MAHTKAQGSAKNLRDSKPKYLGIKLGDGAQAKPGAIIIRQRGSKFYTGEGTAMGKDDTLYAKKEGTLIFTKSRVRRFSGRKVDKTIISVK